MALDKIGQVLKDGVVNATQAIDSLKEQGKEKIAGSVESVKAILPLLAEIGFIFEEMSIDVTIPPQVWPTCDLPT